ncbi:hypothetical protein H5410_009765 [Solanum commersonii]|uniref:Uncharacterized protein n=1 Tax=Solanum commersonii TaxID=4109 RepID=A0A9J6AJQ3_SOLCO|nr:hypothetical protein H5410_009765 [Solanum commersonii]
MVDTLRATALKFVAIFLLRKKEEEEEEKTTDPDGHRLHLQLVFTA